MVDFWLVFLQFLFRTTVGLAVAMGLTPHIWVTSGFYRVHLWVLMGLNTLGALAVWSYAAKLPPEVQPWWQGVLACAIATTICAYLGAVAWLYEQPKLGAPALWLTAGLAGGASLLTAFSSSTTMSQSLATKALWTVDWLTSSALLGTILAGMFLGHWYLNHPGMRLEPLRRLTGLVGASVVARGLVCGMALASTQLGWGWEGPAVTTLWPFLALRWAAGIVLPAMMAWMTWKTLDVPNTQSATGILYAATIVAFIGELTSQLLVLQRLGPP